MRIRDAGLELAARAGAADVGEAAAVSEAVNDMKTITLTPTLAAALEAVRKAEWTYVPGRSSSAEIEIPKLALADALLDAVEVQRRTRLLVQLPKARPAAAGIGKRRRRA